MKKSIYKAICAILVIIVLSTVCSPRTNAATNPTQSAVDYKGNIHNYAQTNVNGEGNLTIKFTQYPNVYRIGGTIQISTPLEGDGSFQGFITPDGKVFFTNITKEGSNGISFIGSNSTQTGTFSDSHGQSGTWNLKQPLRKNMPDGIMINGTITNTSGQNPISADMTLTLETIRQPSGSIDGIIGTTDITNLAGSGSLIGTISNSIVQFTVIANDMQGSTSFTGIENKGALNGNYSATTGENGTWSVK